MSSTQTNKGIKWSFMDLLSALIGASAALSMGFAGMKKLLNPPAQHDRNVLTIEIESKNSLPVELGRDIEVLVSSAKSNENAVRLGNNNRSDGQINLNVEQQIDGKLNLVVDGPPASDLRIRFWLAISPTLVGSEPQSPGDPTTPTWTPPTYKISVARADTTEQISDPILLDAENRYISNSIEFALIPND